MTAIVLWFVSGAIAAALIVRYELGKVEHVDGVMVGAVMAFLFGFFSLGLMVLGWFLSMAHTALTRANARAAARMHRRQQIDREVDAILGDVR